MKRPAKKLPVVQVVAPTCLALFGTESPCLQPNVPLMSAVYPEYLTDANILLCPSDGGCNQVLQEPGSEKGTWNGSATVPPVESCAGGAWLDRTGHYSPDFTNTASYVYISHAVRDSWAAFGVFAGLNEAYGAGGVEAVDTDIDMAALGAPGYGTVLNSDSLMRLREGVERFFITDINNPAATATGQSELPVFFDLLSTTVSEYNHVPGGSNVLYLDGHVAFSRYPSAFPATDRFARAAGGEITTANFMTELPLGEREYGL